MQEICVFSETNIDLAVLGDFSISQDKLFKIKLLALKPLQQEQYFGKDTMLVILDVTEAEILLSRTIRTIQAIEAAAAEFVAYGACSVFIKGDDLHESYWLHDYWTNGKRSFWLTQKHVPNAGYFVTSSIFATAIIAALTLNYSLEDALIIAKMYVSQGMRKGNFYFYHGGFPEEQTDIPYLAPIPLYEVPKPFKQSPYLGFYPVVDSADWVETLLDYGVTTIQLRIKERNARLIDEIKKSVALAKKYQAILFINDYWELALEVGAEAVHLGQEDLNTADLPAIRKQGLLLGVSTYCYHEVARAHAICPSYVAIGPIYPTSSKELEYVAQGLDRLRRWCRTLNYPLVAIGGINIERAAEVVAAGVSGVALISAITQADSPKAAVKQFLNVTWKM